MAGTLQRLVVGVDESLAAAAALRWAATLAAGSGGEVVAVNAFSNPWSEMPPEEHDRLVRERKKQLSEVWIQPALELGAVVRTILRDGDPRRVILDMAEAEEADLVVLGRTGRGGGPGFMHLGSVVEHMAHHTNHPLAVIPPGAQAPIQRIVVGVDGSSESRHAVDWCGGLAVTTGATVVAVMVAEPNVGWTPGSSTAKWRHDAERRLEELVPSLLVAGIKVDSVVQPDLHPADGLLGVASARGGDVLVIGTRGAGGFFGLRAGGVAMKVLHRASLPIVLVPPTN